MLSFLVKKNCLAIEIDVNVFLSKCSMYLIFPFFVFSYYLYMCDKVVAPNVSLTSAVPQAKEVTKTEASKSIPRQSEKPHSSGKHQKIVSYPDVSLEEQEKMDLKTSKELYSCLGKYSEIAFLKSCT